MRQLRHGVSELGVRGNVLLSCILFKLELRGWTSSNDLHRKYAQRETANIKDDKSSF